MASFVELLRGNRNYRYTWIGQIVSEVGDHFNNIAVFSLALATTRSGLVVSGVMLARAIPAILAGTYSGCGARPPGPQTRDDRQRLDPRGAGVRLHPDDSPARHLAAVFLQRAVDVRIAVLHQRDAPQFCPVLQPRTNCTRPIH
jgi:hypothetical protein